MRKFKTTHFHLFFSISMNPKIFCKRRPHCLQLFLGSIGNNLHCRTFRTNNMILQSFRIWNFINKFDIVCFLSLCPRSFRLCSGVKEDDDRLSQLFKMYDNCICGAAPGFSRVCLLDQDQVHWGAQAPSSMEEPRYTEELASVVGGELEPAGAEEALPWGRSRHYSLSAGRGGGGALESLEERHLGSNGRHTLRHPSERIWEESVRMWKGPLFFGFLDHLHFCCFDENYHVFLAARNESYYVMG